MKAKITAAWQGNFKDGIGSYKKDNSALAPVNFKHFASTNTSVATDPEELLGAAHASCFNMTMMHILTQAGFTPDILETSVSITVKNYLVTNSDIELTAKVPGMDEGQLTGFAEKAKQLCTVGRALNADININVAVTHIAV